MYDINLREYKKFTPQERTNLTISALARGDFNEADRLADLCPKKTYIMMEKEYACRMMAIPTIKYIFFEKCVYYYNILVKIDNAIFLCEAMPDSSLCEEDSRYNKLHLKQDIFIGKLKAVHQGFMQFCFQVGLDCDGMLKTIGVEHSCSNIGKYLEYDIEADQEDTESIKIMFLECWQF